MGLVTDYKEHISKLKKCYTTDNYNMCKGDCIVNVLPPTLHLNTSLSNSFLTGKLGITKIKNQHICKEYLKILMFFSHYLLVGPGHPWIVQTYAQKVPHPFASVFGQEVFESGLIPSDTDYRIYRDFGGLPGQ